MKNIKSILVALVLTGSVAMTGCDPSDFGDINVSPNSSSTAYTSMLFTGACRYARNFIMTSSTYDPWPAEWSGYLSEAKNNQYGPLGTTTNFGMGSYYLYAIKNMNLIIEMNENEEINNTVPVTAFGDNNNQIAVAKTLRAFFFMTLTDILGPLPYDEAFQGESMDNWKPAFNSQEEIYTKLNDDLVDAFSKMDPSSNLSDNDLFFGGNVAKWKKFNASLRMMLAIKLADVDPVNGKARFAKAFADGGMTNTDDSFCYTYDEKTSYSWMYAVGNMTYDAKNNWFGPNKVIVDALKEYKDPRMFVYFTIGDDAYLGKRDGNPNDFEAYIGLPFGLESNAAVAEIKNVACSVAQRYCQKNAKNGLITTARTLLVEAEAATLGWINADASALYEAGIRSSFEFEGAADVDEYIAAHPLPETKAEALHEIVMQRFLAGFMMDGIESWSDWRRYNIPTLPIYQGQVDAGNLSYPCRLSYSDSDVQYNMKNTTDAIQKWLGGNDDTLTRLWWDVADNECPLAPGVK